MQLSASLTCHALGIHRIRDRQSVGIELDDLRQRRPLLVELLNSGQVLLGDCTRRVFARRHPLLKIENRRLLQIERDQVRGRREVTRSGWRGERVERR